MTCSVRSIGATFVPASRLAARDDSASTLVSGVKCGTKPIGDEDRLIAAEIDRLLDTARALAQYYERKHVENAILLALLVNKK